MKRVIFLILVFCFAFLCSCDTVKPYRETNDNSKITVAEPTEDSLQDYALNSSKEDTDLRNIESTQTENSNINDDAFEGTYYANTNTHKFHKSNCSSAKQIKDKNLYITTSRDELINSGYSPCLRCNP